jgi:hypothetical protein
MNFFSENLKFMTYESSFFTLECKRDEGGRL